MNLRKKHQVEKNEGLTPEEKRILIGEGTFLSVGFVVLIITAVIYTSSIGGTAKANTANIIVIRDSINSYQEQYVEQMKIYNKHISELNTRMGRMEGKIDGIKSVRGNNK